MQVILKKDIPQLGRIGELVNVKGGYGRNYLIPKEWAVAASKSNVKQLEHHKLLVDVHKKNVQKESAALAESLKGLKVTLERRVNDAGKLYGNILPQEIADELAKQKLVVDRRDVEIEAIKEAGSYTVKVRLPGDVYTDVSLVIKALKEKTAVKAEKKAKTAKPRKAAATSEEESSETPAPEEAAE